MQRYNPAPVNPFPLASALLEEAKRLGVYAIVLAAACIAGLLAISRLARSDLAELF